MKKEGIKLEYEEVKGIPVYKINFALDDTSSQVLLDYFEKRIKEGEIKIILDLKDMEFISTQGLGVIIYLTKTARGLGGDIVLINLSSLAEDIIKEVGLLDFLTIKYSLLDALRHFGVKIRPV